MIVIMCSHGRNIADETGGVLIHDTNDLSAGLRRINDDMRGYYLISYIPKNEDYNGRFRQVSLKLSRPNLEVQTRKGYYAVEAVGQLPVLDYEAPAIAAARNARPKTLPSCSTRLSSCGRRSSLARTVPCTVSGRRSSDPCSRYERTSSPA